MKIEIKAKKVNKKNFKKFGQVIDTNKKKYFKINNGYAKRYDNLGKIDTLTKKGRPIISIFSAKKRRFPMKIDMMEKHPLGSQAFIPMKETIFLTLVAPAGEKPEIDKIESFIIPKGKGVNYKAGVWHFPLIATEDMDFLVVDRIGSGENLIIENLVQEKILLEY